jgi:hypothetical protein
MPMRTRVLRGGWLESEHAVEGVVVDQLGQVFPDGVEGSDGGLMGVMLTVGAGDVAIVEENDFNAWREDA